MSFLFARNSGESATRSFISSRFRDMGLNFFTLSFPDDLEESFLEYYFKKSLSQLRFYVSLAIVFFAMFGILDLFIFPGDIVKLWTVRYGYICPGLLALVLFSYMPRFKDFMQPTLMGVMVLTGLGIIAMVVLAPPPISYTYYAGLLLVLMYGYTFIRIRFVWAAVAGWLIVALYEAAAVFMTDMPVDVMTRNNFFLFSGNIIGMFSCYSIEYYARRDFYLARLLEQEREKVAEANRELEQRVEERTAQLVQANRDLHQEMEERKRAETVLVQSQKMEAIGTLAGGIAHDFNNILTAIIGYAELGIYKKNLGEQKISYSFQQIFQAGNRAKDLIRQILTFSRQQEQQKVPVRVGGIVQEAMKLISATLPKEIAIKTTLATEDDVVLADPTQMHQIVINLCTNAAHAMKEKGGLLEVALREASGRNNGNGAVPHIEFSVRDTGTGMDPLTAERIFDPFFSTKAKGEGTGMGLSVVHGIVKSCGGTIRVETEPGRGSCFRVILPCMDRRSIEAAGQSAAVPSGTERILLIDDEQAMVDVGTEMLQEFGYTVSAYTDPLDALSAFKNKPQAFDLVITDKSMPHMSGFDLAREFFQIQPDIPIILCSGFNDQSEIERARTVGFRDLIAKPLVMSELAATIRKVIDQRN